MSTYFHACQYIINNCVLVSVASRDDARTCRLQINLLDMKRSMNVNIFLKQFKLPNDDIVRLIVDGNHEAIGQEKLKGLLKALPEKEEVCVASDVGRRSDQSAVASCLTVDMLL